MKLYSREVAKYQEIADRCLAFMEDENIPDEARQIFSEHRSRALKAKHIADVCPVAADRIFNNIQH